MLGGRIAAVLAIILALAGWGLYKQVEQNGALQKSIELREQQLRDATGAIDALRSEIVARDAAVKSLEGDLDELRKTSQRVRTVVREVYRSPEVVAWADAVPPASVAAAVTGGIDCLWQHGTDSRDANCGAVATGFDDGRLPAP